MRAAQQNTTAGVAPAPARRKAPVARRSKQQHPDCSPRSTYDPYQKGRTHTAVPDIFWTVLVPKLNGKTEIAVMGAIMRLTYGQKRADQPSPDATNHLSAASLSKEAKVERRMGDIAIEFLLANTLIGRGDFVNGKYRYWCMPENWEAFEGYESKGSTKAEDEEETEEGTKGEIGNVFPTFERFTLRRGAKPRCVRLAPEQLEKLTRLKYETSAAAPLALSHRMVGGEIIVRIEDEHPAVAEFPAPNSPPAPHAPSKVQEVQAAINDIVADRMGLAHVELCQKAVKLMGDATPEDLRLLLWNRAGDPRKLPEVKTGFILLLAKQIGEAAADALKAKRAAERKAAAKVEHEAPPPYEPYVEPTVLSSAWCKCGIQVHTFTDGSKSGCKCGAPGRFKS